jgi:uncharacterized protein YprB with RNaseH-like and TPR domain
LWHHVRGNPRYLDIETTEYRTDITVLGISDGDFYHALVKGRNLSRQSICAALSGATCLVTFNGASFDVPVIEQAYPSCLPAVVHLDLRHICRQAGLTGGLKRIEEHLQLRRDERLDGLDGADAILLWYRHVMGDDDALERLVDYNAADVLNLTPLLDRVLPALWAHVRFGTPVPFAMPSRMLSSNATEDL